MEVLIIGLGSIAAKHIVALRSLYGNITIYALRSGFGPNIEQVINIYSLHELINKPTFIIISNPTQLHLPTILSVADLNIPIFIEKPPLHTLEGSQEIIELIKSKNISTYVACNLRFHPCIQFLKDYLASNKLIINEVNIYCGSYLPEWRPGIDFRKGYSANREMGGGAHLDLFHEMDYTCWLFGYPEWHDSFKSSKSSLEINAVDYASYLLSYPNFNVSIILNYYRKKPKRSIEILFDNDTWVIDLIVGSIYSENRGLIFKDNDFKMTDTYAKQMKYFINSLEDGRSLMNTFEESIRILEISLNNV